MEQTKPNHSRGANFDARKVKEIVEPTKSISNNVSVKAALDEMQARAIDSSPVTDDRGELLGILSRNKMNREVGGFGHDPLTEPVHAHIDTSSPCCFEGQTTEEAELIMLKANVSQLPVVTVEKLLVGTINIEAIAQEKERRKRSGISPKGVTAEFRDGVLKVHLSTTTRAKTKALEIKMQ